MVAAVNNVLQLVGAIVAVAASGIGIIIAVDQLTLRSRLRKTESWAKESALTESNEHRKAALELLRLQSVAGVVGSHAVPLRYFALALVFPSMAIALLIAAYRRGEPTWPDLMVLVLTSVATGGIEGRRGIRLYLERRTVTNAYVDGGRTVSTPRLDWPHTVEGGRWTEWVAGFGFSLGVNAVFVGAGMLYKDGQATFGPALLFVGPVIALRALWWARARGRAA